MKGAIITTLLAFTVGLAIAQSENQKAEKQPTIKEVPPAAAHGKAISELAKSTPSGPEKGKIISGAARQKGIENNQGKNPNENSGGGVKSSRPDLDTKVKGAQGHGKQTSPTRTVPPAKAKPAGFHGGA